MIPRFSIVLCAVLFAWLVSFQPVLAADRTPVPVVSYVSEPAVIEKEGKRAAMILGDQKIIYWPGDRLFNQPAWSKWVTDHKTGAAIVLFVPKDQSSNARVLMARAIKTEGLRLTLLGDDARSVAAESLLQAVKEP